jgi:hypothetical protein
MPGRFSESCQSRCNSVIKRSMKHIKGVKGNPIFAYKNKWNEKFLKRNGFWEKVVSYMRMDKNFENKV